MIEIIEQTHGPDIIEGHLGGCATGGDGGTYYPVMWKHMVEKYNIKSVVDIGCGRGYSTKFFRSMGCDILGIDGAVQAGETSLVPDAFRLNDYEKGSALTESDPEFDLCWSCEFVEHVWEQYSQNFLNDFKKATYVAMTFAHPGQGGHHHVNENTQEYWIQRMKDNGFDYLEEDTTQLRLKAAEDKAEREKIPNVPFFISHFVYRGLFFKRA